MSRTFSNFKEFHTHCEHLCIIFSASAPSGQNLFSITGIKVMTSGIAFDRPDRLSCLRAFHMETRKSYGIIWNHMETRLNWALFSVLLPTPIHNPLRSDSLS